MRRKSTPVKVSLLFSGVVAVILAIWLVWGSQKFGSALPSELDQATQVDWIKMQDLDVKSGVPPSWFANLENKWIKVPGYAVPLEDNLRHVKEFLLVPDPMSCIHVPPPPPNLTVFVSLKQPVKINEDTRAVWVYGHLVIKPTQSTFGTAAWTIEGVRVDPYQLDNENSAGGG